jgi:hypothetical protein
MDGSTQQIGDQSVDFLVALYETQAIELVRDYGDLEMAL